MKKTLGAIWESEPEVFMEGVYNLIHFFAGELLLAVALILLLSMVNYVFERRKKRG